MKKLLWIGSVLASLLLTIASYKHWVSLSPVEVLGFVTGAYCVGLAVIENIWNWPIGIANAGFFLILFGQSHLFADAGLQVVYIILGVVGWYLWLHGGKDKSELKVARVSLREAVILTILGVIATAGVTKFLTSINDVAPFWDGITTVSSLVAQYMLTKKQLENWYVWIATDVIYIALYAFKHLALTAVLYVIFLTMCIIAVRGWRHEAPRRHRKQPELLTVKDLEV